MRQEIESDSILFFFHDRVLRAISRRLPQTTSEMPAIKGCGEFKASAYGDQTLEVVRAYLKSHPEARRMSEQDGSATIRPVQEKPSEKGTFEITWMLWERGGNPEEISRKRGLAPSTITEHLTRLIDEGRPINLNRILSKERIAVIEEAIVRAGIERLASIKALLPQDINYDKIRLVVGQSIQKEKGANKER